MSTQLYLKSVILEAEALEMLIGEKMNTYLSLLRKEREMLDCQISIVNEHIVFLKGKIEEEQEKLSKAEDGQS